MKWREHFRIMARIANTLLVLFLIGSRGWFVLTALGVPVTIVALAVNGRKYQ